MNTVSGRIVVTTCAGSVIEPRRDVTVTRSPSATPSCSASRGCISHSGSGYCSTSAADAPGLRARQVLAHHPAGGEPDRVLVVDHLGRLAERHRVEAGLAVGMEELAALEQARRAGMAVLGDRPEDAHLVLDALPGGPSVVGRAARRREAQLLEDLLGVRVREVLALAEPARDVEQDLPVATRLAGRRRRPR